MTRDVDRRGFLRVAGGTAAGLAVVGGSGSVAAASDRERARLWREWLAAPDTHPQIPNVSYAGYHRGEDRLPRPPVRANVTRFGAVGDGTTDSTAALNAAIDAVGRSGGGTVLVPAGRYRLTGVVWMHHSNVVLRGDGREHTVLFFDESLDSAYRPQTRGEWAWSGGMVWFIPRELRAELEQRGFTGNEGWMDNRELSAVSAGVPRGTRRIPVADPSAFTAGEHVLLMVDNPTDNTLLAHLAGDVPGTRTYPWETAARRLRPELSTWVLAENFRHYRTPVQVERVEPDAVVLAQPVRIDLRLGWRPRFATLGPRVEESGIEDLAIEMRQITQRPHHQDPGFNGPNFQAALNCWARRVDLWHSDNGFGLTTAKGITITEVRVGGRARHHSFICRVQSHDMLVDRFEILPATTPVSAGAAYHGINTEGFTSGNVWSNGVMQGTFDSHKALPFDSVRTAIRVDNTGGTGGAGDAGPRWGARFCHWNIDVTNGRSHAIRLEEHAPMSAMVGVLGTTGPTDHARDLSGPLGSVVESPEEDVLPTNLYESQLRVRLRGM
ncbi:MAG TPA: glycosyl hydrolase family 28-related protein [Actinophytocola sp.]|uniref:glycosyl hydrolase family 28-related protein n=1 Tax=Actinophytocola sp. TaxID=1872138 RepID=UPI002DDCE342|nr:glycosyl hydrolase family 28-related protein [Actinophytocola sp.]HEV2782298.1 glycosyl hydrolase family 28-related protein [Actinophytocola sp.]